jgi:hypothetical protein
MHRFLSQIAGYWLSRSIGAAPVENNYDFNKAQGKRLYDRQNGRKPCATGAGLSRLRMANSTGYFTEGRDPLSALSRPDVGEEDVDFRTQDIGLAA